MRSLILIFSIITLIACKETRHPRMAQTHVEGDTLVIDGPAVVTNLTYIEKRLGLDSQEKSAEAFMSQFKWLRNAAKGDSILVLDTQMGYVRFTDYFKEFPNQTINLMDYKNPLAFYTPGNEVLVLEKWSGKKVLTAAMRGDYTGYKDALIEEEKALNKDEEQGVTMDMDEQKRKMLEELEAQSPENETKTNELEEMKAKEQKLQEQKASESILNRKK